jgi:uncharacterized protein
VSEKSSAGYASADSWGKLFSESLWGMEHLNEERDTFDIYRVAAEQGNPEACYRYGLMCKKGGLDGVRPNAPEAVKWLGLVAEKGDRHAAAHLANLYEGGFGVPRDMGKAYALYRAACADVPDWLFETADKRKEPNWTPYKWDAAKMRAIYRVGLMLKEGIGTQKHETEAFKWLYISASTGDMDAQYHLGRMLADKRGVAADPAAALPWLERAGKQDHKGALYYLGVMHDEGRGTPADTKKAPTFYKAAAKLDHARAQLAIAAMYEQGRGGVQDDAEARQWYFKAAHLGSAEGYRKTAIFYEQGRGGVDASAKDAAFFRDRAEAVEKEGKLMMGDDAPELTEYFLLRNPRGHGDEVFFIRQEAVEKFKIIAERQKKCGGNDRPGEPDDPGDSDLSRVFASSLDEAWKTKGESLSN